MEDTIKLYVRLVCNTCSKNHETEVELKVVCEFDENTIPKGSKSMTDGNNMLPGEKQYSREIIMVCDKCGDEMKMSFDTYRCENIDYTVNDHGEENCVIVSIEEIKEVIENWI